VDEGSLAVDTASAGARGRIATWGSTASERAMPFACDRHLAAPDLELYRAVDVAAPAPVVFRWLCQLRVAPYSYDWIDNFGRRSPRDLVPGLEELEVGQRVMRAFELVEFEPDRHLTALARGDSLLGDVAATYLVVPGGTRRSRLVVKMVVGLPRWWPVRAAVRWLLPAGDLVMMRRQLLNLKGRAEASARGEARA
jgi:hypothetical protein